ncbi:MAG: threonine synthase, partial [Candidatus Neomarinimicrobiota bacterium]
ELMDAAKNIGSTQGLFVCPETAATLVAFKYLRHKGWINDDESVVLFNTGSGLKYAHLWKS